MKRKAGGCGCGCDGCGDAPRLGTSLAPSPEGGAGGGVRDPYGLIPWLVGALVAWGLWRG